MADDTEIATPNIIALHISIPVLDMDKTVMFYVEIFGMQIVSKTDSLTQLYWGDHRISLKKTKLGSSSLQRDSSEGIRSRHIGFRVNSAKDVDLAAAQLLARGINIIYGPEERTDGRTMFCCDPSGNQVEVYYEKG